MNPSLARIPVILTLVKHAQDLFNLCLRLSQCFKSSVNLFLNVHAYVLPPFTGSLE